MAANSRVV
uniref:Uncharacterized protein n=1 Tax=Arundo donax TaxID=35708 RepID=A0A0A8ZI11_ARUDO